VGSVDLKTVPLFFDCPEAEVSNLLWECWYLLTSYMVSYPGRLNSS